MLVQSILGLEGVLGKESLDGGSGEARDVPDLDISAH